MTLVEQLDNAQAELWALTGDVGKADVQLIEAQFKHNKSGVALDEFFRGRYQAMKKVADACAEWAKYSDSNDCFTPAYIETSKAVDIANTIRNDANENWRKAYDEVERLKELIKENK